MSTAKHDTPTGVTPATDDRWWETAKAIVQEHNPTVHHRRHHTRPLMVENEDGELVETDGEQHRFTCACGYTGPWRQNYNLALAIFERDHGPIPVVRRYRAVGNTVVVEDNATEVVEIVAEYPTATAAVRAALNMNLFGRPDLDEFPISTTSPF